MVFSNFTVLCSHHYLIPEHFCHHQKETHTHQAVTSNSLLPRPLATMNLLSVSEGLPILDIPYKWIHRICARLLSFHMLFLRFHTFLFIVEQCSIIWTYHILFMHFSVDGHLGYLHFLAIKYNAVWTFCTSFHRNVHFQFSWVYI